MYTADGRRSSQALIELFQATLGASGWGQEIICYQQTYPIVAFVSPKGIAASSQIGPTDTFWILAGVHGEEPAPTEALANELQTLVNVGNTYPIVLLPLLNPLARDKDWRYEDEYRDFNLGHSVTDYTNPILHTAKQITTWIRKASKTYIPKLVIDHHEDKVGKTYPKGDPRNIRSCYVYVSGSHPQTATIGKEVIEVLKQTQMPIVDSGLTRFGEPISDGVVANSADGSIDEFLSTVATNAVIVVETTIPPDDSIPLQKRVTAHQMIIRHYKSYLEKTLL